MLIISQRLITVRKSTVNASKVEKLSVRDNGLRARASSRPAESSRPRRVHAYTACVDISYARTSPRMWSGCAPSCIDTEIVSWHQAWGGKISTYGLHGVEADFTCIWDRATGTRWRTTDVPMTEKTWAYSSKINYDCRHSFVRGSQDMPHDFAI